VTVPKSLPLSGHSRLALLSTSAIHTMRTRREYDQAFDIVRAAVARWDPYALLGGGAPADEWDAEIASLLPRLRNVKAAPEIVHHLSEVFGGRLGYSSLGVNECSTVAADIFLRLKTAGLLDS
jgi:hypothetical protein